MTKAVVFLGPEGIARTPAILCADDPAEAEQHGIPLFEQVFAQIIAGMEVRNSGPAAYELYERGRRIGTIEVSEPPLLDGNGTAEA